MHGDSSHFVSGIYSESPFFLIKRKWVLKKSSSSCLKKNKSWCVNAIAKGHIDAIILNRSKIIELAIT